MKVLLRYFYRFIFLPRYRSDTWCLYLKVIYISDENYFLLNFSSCAHDYSASRIDKLLQIRSEWSFLDWDEHNYGHDKMMIIFSQRVVTSRFFEVRSSFS